MAGAPSCCCLLSASPSRSAEPRAEPRVYIIEIDKLAFGPTPEGLRVNDIVEWTNVDIFRHAAPGWGVPKLSKLSMNERIGWAKFSRAGAGGY